MHSARWTGSDREAAEDLRRYAVEVDLERQLAREHRAVAARDELLGVVSHDLRNPLCVIGIQAREFLLRASANAMTAADLRVGAQLVESAVERMFNEAAGLATHGEPEEAVARFELLITRYPGTNYARNAEEKIRTIKEKLGI